MTPAWTKGLLLLAIVFIAGGALGYDIGQRSRAMTARAENPMEPHLFVERLGRELHLDSSQRVSIIDILTRRQGTIDSAWRALRPSVRATIDSAQLEIMSVLRPDQRGRYLELVRAAHGGMRAP